MVNIHLNSESELVNNMTNKERVWTVDSGN